jgi:type VI secretion system secreted protein VgrG
VSGNINTSVMGNNLSSSSGSFDIQGDQVVISGLSGITLMSGASFIKIDSTGITLMGPSLKINAGGVPGIFQPPLPDPAKMPTLASPQAPTAADDDVSGQASNADGPPQ